MAPQGYYDPEDQLSSSAAATPYDPHMGRSPGSAGFGESEPSSSTGLKSTAALQGQIDDTVGVMRDNLNKVSQRGGRLETLETKTEDLNKGAQEFRRGANRVRKLMWYKDMKMRMILIAVVVIILLIVIIVPIATHHKN